VSGRYHRREWEISPGQGTVARPWGWGVGWEESPHERLGPEITQREGGDLGYRFARPKLPKRMVNAALLLEANFTGPNDKRTSGEKIGVDGVPEGHAFTLG